MEPAIALPVRSVHPQLDEWAQVDGQNGWGQLRHTDLSLAQKCLLSSEFRFSPVSLRACLVPARGIDRSGGFRRAGLLSSSGRTTTPESDGRYSGTQN